MPPSDYDGESSGAREPSQRKRSGGALGGLRMHEGPWSPPWFVVGVLHSHSLVDPVPHLLGLLDPREAGALAMRVLVDQGQLRALEVLLAYALGRR